MPVSPRMRVVRGWCAAVVLLYALACTLPAIDFGPQKGGPEGLHGTVTGFIALALGWISFLWVTSPQFSLEQRVTGITWLANPLGLLGLIFLACRRPATTATLGALAAGLGVWYLVFPFGKPMVGSYVWVGSMVLLTAGGVTVWAAQRQPTTRRTTVRAATGTSSVGGRNPPR